VLRELRAHVEDFVSAGRQSGSSEEEIERLLLERFGDPRQIAQQFAWVYRRERAALHLGGFLISTVVVSLVILAGTISMQTWIMIGFGAPAVFVHGTNVMALDILAASRHIWAALWDDSPDGHWRCLPGCGGIVRRVVAAGIRRNISCRICEWRFAARHPLPFATPPAFWRRACSVLGFFPPSSVASLRSASQLMIRARHILMTHIAARGRATPEHVIMFQDHDRYQGAAPQSGIFAGRGALPLHGIAATTSVFSWIEGILLRPFEGRVAGTCSQ
jgi:hypothetical protein